MAFAHLRSTNSNPGRRRTVVFRWFMSVLLRLLAAMSLCCWFQMPALGQAVQLEQSARYHPPIVAIGANRSTNWSGYNQGTLEKNIKAFTQVSATWQVPKASQHKHG